MFTTCTCSRRGSRTSRGPDLASLNLFNWNNRWIFSHELLHSYSSQLCASSTPLSAFHTTTSNAYIEHGCTVPFVARSTFNKVFFSFLELQQKDSPFSCPTCGPTPSVVISDGVVLAHDTKLLHVNLRPPTTPGPAEDRQARTGRMFPFLPTAALRKQLRSMIDIVLPLSQHYRTYVRSLRVTIEEANVGSIGTIRSEWIQALLGALQAIFDDCAQSSEVAMRWRNLIQQFAAEESVLQLCRPLLVPLLRSLGSDTVTMPSTTFSQQATSLARHCPAIGLLLLAYQDRASPQPRHQLAIAEIRVLLTKTAALIEHQLLVLGVGPSSAAQPPRPPVVEMDTSRDEEIPFFQSGVLYGAKPVRERKWYSKIEDKHGVHMDDSTQQDNEAMDEEHCRKYFTAYVTAKRTGGLMALWCRHLICLGFHAIPKAEGRNDVFSAIYRFWPVAPEVIVYDFACQLAPYSLHREPEFFKNTLFVVDQMHQHGHTKCSPSSFLSTYMGVNQDLHRLNSSAAESGNAGLARIKKSVSYCSQEHALALVEHFLSIWNRKRALEMKRTPVS